MGNPAASNLRYLEAEFARLDILLRREVRRWVLAGQDPTDDYRGMYVTQIEAETLVDRPFGATWGQSSLLPQDEAVALDASLAQSTGRLTQLAEQLAEAGQVPRFLQLAHDFALERTALDILLLCLAPAFDTKYERLYGYLQDNVTRRRPSVRLVLDLLGEPGSSKFQLGAHLGSDAPLCRHGLIWLVAEPPPANDYWLNQALQADETLVAWLRGAYEHHGVLAGCVTLTRRPPSGDELILAGDLLPPASSAISCEAGSVYALYGSDRNRQDAFAQVLAAASNCSLLTVDLPQAPSESVSVREFIRAALRDARLTGAAAYLRHWDVCVDADGRPAAGVLDDLLAHPGPVIVAGAKPWQPSGMQRPHPIRWLPIGVPDYRQRRVLWRHYLQAACGAASAADAAAILPDGTFDALATQFALTSGAIRDAVLAATNAADESGPAAEDLFASARAYSNLRLEALARKIVPRYEWCDIVLPLNQHEILRELVANIRHRSKVMEEWGVGRKLVASAGVAVLFAGPPGTGKTMAAEVVARELGLDLYKIDLASVVSKYIGETEKNLERIFGEAGSSNAILFFDEADALFGKRSEVKDAHDRYANIEVSYLLQRMEVYEGLTILATNLRANLDEAFTRRLHYIVDFPFPRADERRRIWSALFPQTLPRAADLDLDLLARRYELAGGSIRNVIVAAAYLAANDGQLVTMEHLQHGVRRELQKMGRLLGEKDFGN
jgi:hypothetical protein